MPLSQIFCADCLPAMREYPDKFFDLAVVDVPYGGGQNEDANDSFKGAVVGRFGGRFEKYHLGQEIAPDIRNCRGRFSKYKDLEIRHWDFAPPQEYFDELMRVSKNQIIFGGNYFSLPPTRCFIVWRKTNIPKDGFTMAPIEYAWTSFNENARIIELPSSRNEESGNFHPTEKPIALYRWIYQHYAKEGDKILDTHMGSQLSRIAAWDAGLDYIGYEIDPEYYRLGEERFERHRAQMSLFIDKWR